ncbi:MAG: aminoacyl-tRNA hydrolase [Verrucomicrobiota bacterium]|nr:aminoacyl-tRNA hydrolase [Verrucomicrobiota bacterium]
MRYLIVGLGNPGKKYEGTRHNIGFAAVDLLAKKHGLEFRKSLKVQGARAEGMIAGEPCLLLKPLTFMNLSGESVALTMRYASIDLSSLLVLVDDVAIPLGEMRLKINSSAGGHNGLKSIEESLQTDRYARLRLGVGDCPRGPDDRGDLSSHVLGRFSSDEEKLIPALLKRAVETTELFITKGLTRAMDFANQRSIDSKHREVNE